MILNDLSLDSGKKQSGFVNESRFSFLFCAKTEKQY
jgi:hypothetical protein